MSMQNTSSQNYLDKEHFFDDFKYSKITFPATYENSKSLFGSNPWLSKQGYVQSEAWRRYSFPDSNYFGNKMQMTIDSIGFNMTMKAGFDKKVGYLPTVNSTFLVSEGIIASRIKFPKMSSVDKMNHAFFLWSPVMFMIGDLDGKDYQQYWAEMDFEYNNCFYNDTESRIKIGCNNYDGKYVRDRSIDCIVRKNGKYHGYRDCVGNFDGFDMISENWMIYIFRINKLENRIEFGIISDDENLDFEIWGGHSYSSDGWGKYAYIDNYYPQYLLQTFYTIGACSDPQLDHTISVDWFYYSPNPEMTYSELRTQVKKLQADNIERLNTTKNITSVETAELAQNNLSISGPNSTISCRQATWKIEPMYKGRHFYRMMFSYRVFSQDFISDWINIEAPELKYTPKPTEDSIQLRLIYRDEWIPPVDTIYYTCTIEENSCNDFIRDFIISSISPNPTNDYLNIRLEILSETTLSIDIYDVTGDFVSSIYHGNHIVGIANISNDITDLSQGVYYVRVKTEKFRDDRMFVIMR